MYRNIIAFFLLFTLSIQLNGQSNTKSIFLSPIKIPLSFSGGFGELRRNHFHTGLDFRTAGQIGLPVYAVKEGSVARVSVSPTGYGHALYLVHPDGHTTVYGHLSRFQPKIEDYVIEQQYKEKKFAVNLDIPVGLFSIKKGEIIAWSGNSGSSGGPHLHFEIRDTQSEKPQNPLFFLSGISDKSSPRITSLYLYPLSTTSHDSKFNRKVRLETISTLTKTSLKNQTPIEVFGDIGLGIQCDDDFNGAGLKCGVYSIELFLDEEPEFSFKMDHLAFDQGRYVNSHIDYEELIKSKRWIYRLYLQPGNKMDIYQTNSDRGILKLTDGKIHTVKIVAADAFGNFNTFQFKLISKTFPVSESKVSFTKSFEYDKINNFENEEVKILLPEWTLYDKLNFDYKSFVKSGPYYSKIHQIHHSEIPVHKPYQLSIKTKAIPYKLQSKALIVQVDPKGNRTAIGGDFANDWITAYPRFFGDFGIVLDTIPPVIKPVNIPGNRGSKNATRIEFKISDNISGIANYEGLIDGNWALFEYDAKISTVFYTIDRKRISLGKMHSLQFTVLDERKNSSVYKVNFKL